MVRRLAYLVLAATLLPAASAAAQGARCTIVTDNPAQLRGARTYVLYVASLESSGRNEKPRHLQSGMRVLLEDQSLARHQNQMGRAYLLGKLAAVWIRQDGANSVETRKTLGLSGDQNATIDLYRMIDSAFTIVENANPACMDSTRAYREAAFSDVYNPAVAAANARQYDSALVLARRALIVSPKSAQTWNLIAQAHFGKGEMEPYAEALKKVMEFGPLDPRMKGPTEQAYFNLGTLRMQDAQRAEGDQQRALAREAEEIFRKYSELKPDDPTGKVRRAQALQILGDTAGVQRIYSEMLAAPEQYSATALAEAGVASYRGRKYTEAMAFFDASLKKNPYHSQTLFNYINTALSANRVDDAVGRLPQLFAVDPSNTDNYTLAARGWQMILRDSSASQTPARRKLGEDSTLHYIKLGSEAKVSVRFQPFAPVPGNAQTLAGIVENRGDAARSFELAIECLAADGSVVASATAPVTDVAAGGSKQFRVNCSGANIVAFRYKPVT